MRIETLALKGLLRFADPVSLDLRDVPPGLVAITGENGAGKTTILEALFAALYREWPSRAGELVAYATGRDSFLDCTFSIEGRGAYRARVNLDGVRGSSDALLEAVQADGARVPLNDGKVSTYRQAVERECPSRTLLLASALSAQNRRGNLIGMKPAEAKRLFGELLGLAHYETMSQTARTLAETVTQAIGRLAAVRDLLGSETTDAVADDLDRLANALQVSGGQTDLRQRELRALLTDLEARLAAVQESVTAYTAAAQRVLVLERELAGRQAERRTTTQQRETAEANARADAQRIEARCGEDLAAIDQRIEGNQTILAKGDDIRRAAADLAALETTLATARADLDRLQEGDAALAVAVREAERELADRRDAAARLATARNDAGLLETVPCGGAGAYARCQFLLNARAALAQIPALEAIVASEPDIRARLSAKTTAQEAQRRAVQDRRVRIKTLETDRFTLQASAKYAEPLAAAEARIAELTTARAQVVDAAGQALGAAQATLEARRGELDAQAARLDQTVAQLLRERDAAQTERDANEQGHARALVLQQELAGTRIAWDGTTAERARVAAQRADLERRREDLRAKRAALADVQTRIGRLEAERDAWAWLGRALGRDGLQVLEIDAAGPAVSADTNRILECCFGPRFSVELVTQVERADGKGQREKFSLQVLDNEQGGAARYVEDLSGGEQVIVSEALMSAISLYVNARSPQPIRTCWRDETTGALDPANAARYLAMLRRVHELGGFHHTFFITHNPEIAAQADAQIRVAGGQASLVLAPFEAAA